MKEKDMKMRINFHRYQVLNLSWLLPLNESFTSVLQQLAVVLNFISQETYTYADLYT